MAKFSQHVAQRIQVQYRAGEVVQSARGTLVADTGRSIFLEESSTRKGTRHTIRWEIPYQFILAVTALDSCADEESNPAAPSSAPHTSRPFSLFPFRKPSHEA